MFEPTHFQLVIQVELAQTRYIILENVSFQQKVAAVIQEALRQLGQPSEEVGWCLVYRGTVLSPDVEVGFSLSATIEPLELILRRATLEIEAEEEAVHRNSAEDCIEPAPAEEDGIRVHRDNPPDGIRIEPAPADEDELSFCIDFAEPALGEADTDLESSEFELSLECEEANGEALSEDVDQELESEEEADGDVAACEKEACQEDCTVQRHPAGAVAADQRARDDAQGKARRGARRRATVRYYSRMNPERVYPLLVLITRDMVEKVQKKDTDQRSSSPFKVDTDVPVEVEPVLPGCSCHPPKIVTRLSKRDLTLTFRVVPQVLGRVDGAVVSIRQNHASLAEVELEVKVVQRTWVALSVALTFLLPGLSAILKHFGLDFETQTQQGFSLYLATARLMFDKVSPFGLTAILGLGTGLLWWLTRPRLRDAFWEMNTVGPEERLKRIAAFVESDPKRAAGELMELLSEFPNYQPVCLFYAEWHYRLRNYKAALTGYAKAFRLGVAQASHYFRASQAASQLGQNKRAIQILEEADRVLPSGQMTGVMLFNTACYHVRLGNPDKAMACLTRAIKAGYRKLESFLKDPDLKPLRPRLDFKQMVDRLKKATKS
ncbi:MAG TPA: hypothetical protein VN688_10935 [Gemmataceae bacterium]|nr:hypothetical protein [Gemmataceae bacterium]